MGLRKQPSCWRRLERGPLGNAPGVRTGFGTGILYNGYMAVETTYTQLRETLASVLDRVVDDREIVIVRRRGAKDVALIPAEELAGLLETAHLLRSPKNAQRLFSALRRAEKRIGVPQSISDLRRDLGFAPPR